MGQMPSQKPMRVGACGNWTVEGIRATVGDTQLIRKPSDACASLGFRRVAEQAQPCFRIGFWNGTTNPLSLTRFEVAQLRAKS